MNGDALISANFALALGLLKQAALSETEHDAKSHLQEATKVWRSMPCTTRDERCEVSVVELLLTMQEQNWGLTFR